MVAKAKLSIVGISDKNNPLKELTIRPISIKPANQMIFNLQSGKNNTMTTRWELNGMRG